MRGKGRGGGNLNLAKKLGLSLPAVLFLCLFFFLAGFFGSILISQDVSTSQPKPGLLRSVYVGDRSYDLLSHGVSGDGSLTSIPFQVLSWRPRILYFPKFATKEECDTIIDVAKTYLKPSSLALREGETEETTKGVRTSSGMFIGASEDNTGVLDLIEERIARATMIPRTHGEAFNILRYEIGQKYDSHYDAFNPAEYGPQKSQRVWEYKGYSLPSDSFLLPVALPSCIPACKNIHALTILSTDKVKEFPRQTSGC